MSAHAVSKKDFTVMTVVDIDVNNPPAANNTGRVILHEKDSHAVLGFGFSSNKKWAILTSVFIVLISLNFNAAVFGNAAEGIAAEFDVSHSTIKVAQMLFLVMYAFGCEAWAPFSEDLGRKWVLQGSLFLVNVWAMACGLSTNFEMIMAFRALGGLSSAGGSVTLGMVADMWEPEAHQYPLAFVVFSSVAGSVVGPIAGGFTETYLNWRWIFWVQLIFGVVAQSLHMFVPETRSSIMLDRHAQRVRKTGENPNVYGENEAEGTFWECFSDALIFTSLDSFPMVLHLWNFSKIAIGLSFIPLMIGYILGYLSFLPVYAHDQKVLREKAESFRPERRLWLLLFFVVLEPIGLVGFGFGSLGPESVHWMVPLFFTALIGIANFAIYMATIDYMVAAYGPYAASATGGNGFCRDFLAGLAALYTKPFYNNIATSTKYQLPAATWILSGIAALLCIPVYVFYFKGEWFRNRSKFAQDLAKDREQARADSVPSSRRNSVEVVEA